VEPSDRPVREGAGLKPVASILAGAGIPAFLALAFLGGSEARHLQQNPVVIFETEKGAIEMEVDAVRAPISAANFLKYVEAKLYDGGSVNRAVRPDNTVRHDVEIQVIQFQIDAARRRPFPWSAPASPA
jgi:hypothetical protein